MNMQVETTMNLMQSKTADMLVECQAIVKNVHKEKFGLTNTDHIQTLTGGIAGRIAQFKE